MVALIGADGTVTEVPWAELNSFGEQASVVRDADLVPSVGGGTREAVVSAGWVRVCRCFAKFSGPTSVSLAANGGANARRDYRVAEFNWGSSASALGTPANSVEIKTVQGGSGGAIPSLIQTPGVLWQEPLGLYRIPAGGGAITVEDVRAIRLRIRTYTSTIDTTIGPSDLGLFPNSDPAKVAEIEVPNQGGRYRLRLDAVVNFQATASGHGRVFGYVDSGSGDELISSGRGTALNVGPAVLAPADSPVFTGPVTARLFVVANSMNNPDRLLPSGFGSSFACTVLPA